MRRVEDAALCHAREENSDESTCSCLAAARSFCDVDSQLPEPDTQAAGRTFSISASSIGTPSAAGARSFGRCRRAFQRSW